MSIKDSSLIETKYVKACFYIISVADPNNAKAIDIVKIAVSICNHLVQSMFNKEQSKIAALSTQTKFGVSNNLLSSLFELAISDCIDSNLRSKIFDMLADVLRDNNKNQLIFASMSNTKPLAGTKCSLLNLAEKYKISNYSANGKKSALLHALDFCLVHYYNYDAYIDEYKLNQKGIVALNSKQLKGFKYPPSEDFGNHLDETQQQESVHEELDLWLPFREAIAAENLIQALLFGNCDGQMLVASSFCALDPRLMNDSNFALPFGRVLLLPCHLFFSNPNSGSYQLAFWCSIRIMTYIFRDNLDVKEVLLKYPLEIPANEVNPPPCLPDVLSNALLYLHPASNLILHVNLLFLLCEWCYQNTAAIDMFFKKPPTANPFFCHLIHCASNTEFHVQIRGLATFLLSLCLDIHQNVDNFFDSSISVLPPPLLFDIIANKIGVEIFKNNSDAFSKQLHEFEIFPTTQSGLSINFAKMFFGAAEVSFAYLYDRRFLNLSERIHESSEKQLLKLFASAAKHAFALSVKQAPSSTQKITLSTQNSVESLQVGTKLVESEAELQQIKQELASFKDLYNAQSQRLAAAEDQVRQMRKQSMDPPDSISTLNYPQFQKLEVENIELQEKLQKVCLERDQYVCCIFI